MKALGALVVAAFIARAGHLSGAVLVGQESLRLGMSSALSGPAADLGLAMRAGVLAGIEEQNRRGGAHGIPLELIALDDGYEPSRTSPNMRDLVEGRNVLAVVGNVGTPTAVVAIPIAKENKTLFFGAYTGAGMLRRSPPDHWVLNYRASYAEETAAMVDALVDHAHLKPGQVAFFTQRDAYGDSGFAGGVAALKRHGLANEQAVAHVRYERNTLAIEKALADLLALEMPPRAVVMVGAYGPCAAFIQQACENQLDAIFLNVSFVGANSLAKALGPAGEGVIVTQVVPHFESQLPAVQEYRSALHAALPGTEPGFGSLEGYLVSRILCRALELAPKNPTREQLVSALESLGEFDLGLGEPLRFSPDQHQASHRVWPTILHEGRYLPLDWTELSGPRKGRP